MKAAARALDHIHSKGLVHNGLTAKKFFLGPEDAVKLDVFEMACPAREFDPAQLVPDLIADTQRLTYIAPEVLRGDAIDGRAEKVVGIVLLARQGDKEITRTGRAGVR